MSAAFGKKSTAEEVARGISLEGKHVIVTGGGAGLGAETARVLAKAGAHVQLAVRSVEGGEQTARELRKGAGGAVTVAALNLADLGSVQTYASEVVRQGKPISLLINNAGIMATPLGFTAQGYEQQMGTNHLGHFLLTKLLLPALARDARVVTVSSDLHKSGTREGVLATLDGDPKYAQRKYAPFKAYGDSKLANVLFARALAKRLPAGMSAFSLHPGVIATRLSRHMGIGGALFRFFGAPFFKSIPQGAATTVFAATAPGLESRSGSYLSDCAVVPPFPLGEDDALTDQVWAISEQKVAPFVPAAARAG